MKSIVLNVFCSCSSDAQPSESCRDLITAAGHTPVEGDARTLLGADALFICICGRENRRVKEDLNLALDKGIPVAYMLEEGCSLDSGLDIQLAIAAKVRPLSPADDIGVWLTGVSESVTAREKKKKLRTAVILTIVLLLVADGVTAALTLINHDPGSTAETQISEAERLGVDVEALKGKEKIDLAGLGLTDISFLKDCTSCRDLDISNNSVSDISVLAGLTELKVLKADNNKIVDISVLNSASGLQVLSIRGNKVKDINVLLALTELREADIRDNQIEDYTAVNFLSGVNIQN